MFKRISRYLFVQVSGSSLALLCILLSALWFSYSLRFIDLILKSRESFATFFKLSLLAIPDLIIIILPITILIGIISVYTRLQSDNELIVMSASGYSNWSLARPAFFVALLGVVIVYFLNLFVLHSSFREMRDMEHKLKSSLPNVMVKQGVFNTFGNLTIYVQKKKGKHHLEGVLAYVKKPGEDPYTIIAKKGNLFIKNDRPTLMLHHGNRQIMNKDGYLSIVYFEETVVDLADTHETAGERPKKPYELSLKEIFSTARNTGDKNARQRLVAEALQRLFTPWYTLGFASLALAFLFSGEYRRTGRIKSITYSALSALLLQGVGLLLMNMGSKHWQALPLAFALMFATIFGSIWSLLKPSFIGRRSYKRQNA